MYNNFHDQYNSSKQYLVKAIQDNNNIVIWGEGANGKSYLCNELKDIWKNNYYILHEASYQFIDYVNSNGKKFIYQTNNLNDITKSLKFQNYVFINMNNFKYPKYSVLRSGRCI